MTPKHLYLLLLSVVATGVVSVQIEDALQIPVENDNQFPPDTIEGSGNGVNELPDEIVSETTMAPPIEQIESKMSLDVGATPSEDEDICPKPCVCRIEGATNDFVIDCSGYDLIEFPSPLNKKATVLNVQKNKLTEIPKVISTLKNLKELNANNNSIMNLVSGSISELPELVTLKLGNNKLIEYPNDLKNSFGLTKLEYLDLGGNDMRTALTTDLFTKFESLREVILPSSTTELQHDLCDGLSKTLEKVCVESCVNQLHECQNNPNDEQDLPVLPGMLALPPNEEENADPVVNDFNLKNETEENIAEDATVVTTTPKLADSTDAPPSKTDFSFRSAINKEPGDVTLINSPMEVARVDDKAPVVKSSDSALNVGATTESKTGGVDKSIIGIVVAAMVVVVAGITIKKNWNSIKKRFSSNSNSRTPTDRTVGSANGAAPEEVPLQDKSPV